MESSVITLIFSLFRKREGNTEGGVKESRDGEEEEVEEGKEQEEAEEGKEQEEAEEEGLEEEEGKVEEEAK